MNDTNERASALNISLKPSEPSAHPRAANFTNVGIAQGIAYVDFGFLEPTVLGAMARTVKEGQAGPKAIDGQLVVRMAMGVDVLVRLHQQIQHVLNGLRAAPQPKPKT